MALSKFTKDMGIISALDDEPNDVGGLTATELKAKFDEGGQAIKAFINDTLTTQADQQFATKQEVQGIVLGQVPDHSITPEKLAEPFASAVVLSAVDFTASSWTAVMEEDQETVAEYTMTILPASHGRTSANFICGIWHLVDGKYSRNTWAAQTTDVHYDAETGNIILTSSTAYSGKATFMG